MEGFRKKGRKEGKNEDSDRMRENKRGREKRMEGGKGGAFREENR